MDSNILTSKLNSLSMARSFDNYAFYAFYLIALALFLIQPRDPQAVLYTLQFYLVLTGLALGLTLLAPQSLVEFAALKPSIITLRFVAWILPIMVLSNCFLYWAPKVLAGSDFVLRPFSIVYWINRLFFGGVKNFVEEFMFRGFLLIPLLSKNVKLFWIANVAQAAFFAFIHSLFEVQPNFRISFIIYVFILSIVFGSLNRTFKSLMPSWVLHSTNGILSSWIFMDISGAP